MCDSKPVNSPVNSDVSNELDDVCNQQTYQAVVRELFVFVY